MIEELFKTPVYNVQLDVDNDKLYKDCLRLKRKEPMGNKVSNRGGYQSGQLLGHTDEKDYSFKSLSESIAKQAGIFAEGINLEVKKLKDLWYNINNYKDHNIVHNHIGHNNKLSGVYYVKAPKNSGNLVLDHPSNLVELTWAVNIPKGHHNTFTSSVWQFVPKPGQLLIFPSWLEHSVEANLSKSPRVSFSFNIV